MSEEPAIKITAINGYVKNGKIFGTGTYINRNKNIFKSGEFDKGKMRNQCKLMEYKHNGKIMFDEGKFNRGRRNGKIKRKISFGQWRIRVEDEKNPIRKVYVKFQEQEQEYENNTRKNDIKNDNQDEKKKEITSNRRALLQSVIITIRDIIMELKEKNLETKETFQTFETQLDDLKVYIGNNPINLLLNDHIGTELKNTISTITILSNEIKSQNTSLKNRVTNLINSLPKIGNEKIMDSKLPKPQNSNLNIINNFKNILTSVSNELDTKMIEISDIIFNLTLTINTTITLINTTINGAMMNLNNLKKSNINKVNDMLITLTRNNAVNSLRAILDSIISSNDITKNTVDGTFVLLNSSITTYYDNMETLLNNTRAFAGSKFKKRHLENEPIDDTENNKLASGIQTIVFELVMNRNDIISFKKSLVNSIDIDGVNYIDNPIWDPPTNRKLPPEKNTYEEFE